MSCSLFPQYEFSPQTLCCYGKQLCTIPTGGTYYSYQNRYVCTVFFFFPQNVLVRLKSKHHLYLQVYFILN